MKIPYNRVHAHGDVLLAARGGKIHTFGLLDGKHISTWQHPDVLTTPLSTAEATSEAKGASSPAPVEAVESREADGDEPPAKRQRLENGEDGTQGDGEGKGKAKGKKKGKKAKPEGQPHQVARAPERPVITQVTTTADGRHVLAVSGHDKVIWVFEHDGQGGLRQISQRTMPKRPSAVTIAADSQIISADKFGDVYTLPLLPAPQSPSSAALRSSTPNPLAKPAALAANTLVVHSKRNLEALRHQKKQLELRGEKAADAVKEGPSFELTLLLGHVSMLTSLALGESEGCRYILSSDRDEHIRVSRYIPQAHVIEGFCLGHKEFVSELVIPPSRGEVLVSGGGDEELFVWDWKAGKLLSKTSVVSVAQKIAPETAKVAVSGLHSLLYPSESGSLTYILAICEGIKAIFSWQLTDHNTLNRPGVIQLPAAPLHLFISASENAPPKLIVAMDPGESSVKSLHAMILTASNGRLSVDTESSFRDEGLEADEADASESEIRRLLYTVESLRKQTSGGEDEGAADAEVGAEMEADEAPAADD
ncbi:tRNA (guanine-N(7)-)-methyltransferase non-catalytic subunit trm82 [Hirsutella rhossiliensis]|uniref:tRNA (Guanine-N(7)-)-methyltransferase non-catalytic subunit trm82 n=1 Tax=Hirsutella rhossiliensis TaxID=111463 RepID=A0A9P8SIG9_9HYPO|nr:tRNA (guanine-N(7)-)-methyltransferase non-catalytic subunit trm82 [Hirsutella rhossiliensis]KAH0963169.1 tRNA (guanine-N(7)-)-methyltransferase non-catalytic subunit trm82 [Hirsutella rhossiliensis]